MLGPEVALEPKPHHTQHATSSTYDLVEHDGVVDHAEASSEHTPPVGIAGHVGNVAYSRVIHTKQYRTCVTQGIAGHVGNVAYSG